MANKALSFDGNDYVNCGAPASLDNEAAGTVEFWVLRRTGGGGGVIERRSPAGGWKDQRYTFDFTSDTPRFNIADGATNQPLNFNGTITNGQWYYLVGTHDGTKMKGYISGGLDKEQNQTITPEMTGYDLRIGWVQDLGRYLDGIIDEVRISNIARTAEEIEANWNNGLGKKLEVDEHTVALWHMDEGEGGTIFDETENHNDGIIYGASWVDGFPFPIIDETGRIPYNSEYCKEVNCPLRSGNKCTVEACPRKGAEKWPAYFTIHGHLADGDAPDA